MKSTFDKISLLTCSNFLGVGSPDLLADVAVKGCLILLSNSSCFTILIAIEPSFSIRMSGKLIAFGYTIVGWNSAWSIISQTILEFL